MPPALVLDALFAHAPVGLAVWDRDLRYQRITAPLAAINGVPVEAHHGRRPSEVLPDLGPRLEELLRGVFATGAPLPDVDVVGETPLAPGVQRRWVASY